MASMLGIARFHLDDSSSKGNKYCQTFSSTRTRMVDLNAEAGGTLGATEFTVKVEKQKAESDVAVCIPSDPLEVIALRGEDVEWQLRAWWEEWRHNIACNCGSLIDNSPIFLVLEKTDTDQVFNCYYKGTESETNLRLKGNLVDRARISLEAGFACEEIGNFGFKESPREEGRKWSIFIQKEELKLFRFRKLKALIKVLFQ